MKDYHEEFNKFKKMFEEKENFAFSRFSDGEIFILKNERLILSENGFVTGDRSGHGIYPTEERKDFDPDKHSYISDRLNLCLSSYKHNYFKGLSCNEDTDICLEDDVLVYQKNISGDDEDHHTFATVFINANYPRFMNEIVPIIKDRPIVLVTNENCTHDALPFSNIVKVFNIGSNCIVNDFNLPDEINEWIEENNIENTIFLVAASTLSNFIIKDCFFMNPQNTYIDIGSSLSPWMGLDGWKYSRAYLQHWILGHPNKYGTQVDTWS
jgi:hypothetical protein|tara:strand:+ start:1465 stop:2268 length:804 start_codon:yes stop_codon:yes gene_type:complete